MKLTSYSNYTMRVLMVAAARDPQLTTVGEIAESFGISTPHVVKCVHQLGVWGYLETVRGNRGGFRLAKRPEKIGVGEVIRRTEAGFIMVECFDPETNTCPIIAKCKLRAALRRATDAFLAELDGLTLADIASNGSQLLRALELTAPTGCRAA
jgi:Rrf2 family transcriptional regulator, nitric oxide-sensitive transcriptional repressor